MNFRAQSTFTPVDISRLMAKIVPIAVEAVTEGCAAVVEEAQGIAPVETGELRDSIHTQTVELVGAVVRGTVIASAPHAGYVEYGTGIRGAASPGAGPYPYSPTWPGMMAQPFMRPALDIARPNILDAFRKRGFSV